MADGGFLQRPTEFAVPVQGCEMFMQPSPERTRVNLAILREVIDRLDNDDA